MNIQNSLTIRTRQPADFPALGQVLVRVYDADGYPVEGVADPEKWLVRQREIAAWTVLLDKEPIGHISLTRGSPEDDAARLWAETNQSDCSDVAVPVRLFVDPPHRGLGAGRELMLAAYQHATKIHNRLVFDVMLKDKQAIRLYEGLGCVRLGTITHHHSGGRQEPAAVYVAPETMPDSQRP